MEEKKLIDPMCFEESEQDLETKKQKWMDIFNRCPDFANVIIDLYNDGGEDVINRLIFMHKDKEWHLGLKEEE